MVGYNFVDGYYHRRAWNETWDYPKGGSLLQLTDEVPILAPFYLEFEKNYMPLAPLKFAREYYWIAPTAAILYLICVYVGYKMMENRTAFDLRGPLKYWNLFLSIFSLWGAIRIVPHLIFYVRKVGFLTTLCSPAVWSHGNGPVSFWLTLFVFSKLFEYIDTVFIVLRKKPLTFLHWFHHASAVVYAWDAYVTEQPAALHLSSMNYSIHAIMYFYYYLAAVGKPPKWGMIITVLQITQMIIGLSINSTLVYLASRYDFISYSTAESAFKPFEQNGCSCIRSNIWIGVVLYGVFFYLFVDFFLQRYMSSKAVPITATAQVKKRE